MRLHIIALPHTQTTKAFGQCAYTQKTRKFATMMHNCGHEVYLYASEDNEAKATELITCITKKQQEYFLNGYTWWPNEYYKIPYKDDFPIWSVFNNAAILELNKRVKKGDVVCMTAGQSQLPIYERFPYNCVEFAVGYEGIASKYRVFESYPWMHYVYGLKRINFNIQNDVVIPNYFDVEDFEFSPVKDNYFLFMSRPVKGKGIEIAKRIAKITKTKLIVAGAERIEGEYVEWVGYADPKKRSLLMSRAKALLCPTLAIEPFGGVVAEAAMCGTPAITSDWGAFLDTVEQRYTGFRCRTLEDFIRATTLVSGLNFQYIRNRAIGLYSTRACASLYNDYFQRIKAGIDAAVIFPA